MQKSISTIDGPEFINLAPVDISPLMRKCDIKVFYLGGNHNKTWIDKDVALEMAKTLRGAPIVGYYSQEKEDFGDHGKRVIIDHEGVKFECLTKPYGFVPPDAKVWFQKFEETDYKTNEVVTREYMMTTGFLWTGQFPEANQVFEDGGKGQSMEFDDDTFSAEWSRRNGIEFAIVNDAIFSKLCILGDSTKPCFETASVMDTEISANYSLMDDNFKSTLYSMMQDLQVYLEKGGQTMQENEKNTEVAVEETIVKTSVEETPVTPAEEPVATDFTKKEDEEDKKDSDDNSKDDKDDSSDDSDDKKDTEDKDDDEDKKKYQLLEAEYNELQTKYVALETEYQKLVEYKNSIEDAKKDEMINSFYMLSDEDKADVIANKSTYSLDEIEAKLSVICVRKKVDFSLGDEDKEEKEEKEIATTFSLDADIQQVPTWFSLASSMED